MMKLLITVLAVAAGLATAEIIEGTCPEVTNVATFDAAEFLGRWYEISRFPADFEDGMDCVTVDAGAMEHQLTTFWLNVTGDMGPHIKNLEGNATLTDVTGQFNASVDTAPNMLINVLDTDYKTYGSLFACNQLDATYMDQYAWINGRHEELSHDAQQKAHEAFTNNNIDVTRFEHTRQGGDCKYNPHPQILTFSRYAVTRAYRK